MSLLVPLSETTFTDACDASDINQNNENKRENEKNINNNDELNSNCDNGDIQKILIETEKNLEKIIKLNSETFDKFMNQSQLSWFNQSSEKLKMNDNNNNNNNSSPEIAIMEYKEDKSNTFNVKVKVTHGSILGDGDSSSVALDQFFL